MFDEFDAIVRDSEQQVAEARQSQMRSIARRRIARRLVTTAVVVGATAKIILVVKEHQSQM